MTGENEVNLDANMYITYWSVGSFSFRGGDIVILASCKFHSIRVHDNLVFNPINNKSIVTYFLF